MMLHRGRAGFWSFEDHQSHDDRFGITLLF